MVPSPVGVLEGRIAAAWVADEWTIGQETVVVPTTILTQVPPNSVVKGEAVACTIVEGPRPPPAATNRDPWATLREKLAEFCTALT
jgi:hypothetical protein